MRTSSMMNEYESVRDEPVEIASAKMGSCPPKVPFDMPSSLPVCGVMSINSATLPKEGTVPPLMLALTMILPSSVSVTELTATW